MAIPQTIKRSEKHAQHLWQKAHDSAIQTYGEGRRAHQVAYAALKHQYAKQGDHWVKKGWSGPSDPQAARGPHTRKRSTDEPRAATARGKVARTASAAKRKAKAADRENARVSRRRQSRPATATGRANKTGGKKRRTR